PDGTCDITAGAPAPPAANVRPATVMERRVTPRCIVDPCRAPAADVGPVAVAIGRPVDADAGRIPDGAVIRGRFPAAVLVEIGIPAHLPRYVAAAARAVVVSVAIGTPCIEAIVADAVAQFRVRGRRAVERGALARQYLLDVHAGVDDRLAFAHGELR